MVNQRRLFRAQYQDISIVDRVTIRKYRVSGSKNDIYDVDIQSPSCTCLDWKKREPNGGCKHILAVKLAQGEIEALSYPGKNRGTKSSLSRYPEYWEQHRKNCLESDRYTCQKCGAEGGPYSPVRLHVHHIKPKSQGGSDALSNLITVCHACHEDVHNHAIPEFERAHATTFSGSHSGIKTDKDSDISTQDNPSKQYLESSSHSEEPTHSRSPKERQNNQSEVDTSNIPRFDEQIHFIPPWSQSHPRNQEQQARSQFSNGSIATTQSENDRKDTESMSGSPKKTLNTQDTPADKQIKERSERNRSNPNGSDEEEHIDESYTFASCPLS